LSQEQVPSLLIQHLPNRLRFTLQQKIARAAQAWSRNCTEKLATWYIDGQRNNTKQSFGAKMSKAKLF
jgi:hypothetical protein